MASFTGATSRLEKETTPPVRAIAPDNKFKDKLKAFKTFEQEAVAPPPMSRCCICVQTLSVDIFISRRESEPVLSRPRNSVPQFKTSLTSSSSSSSFMNTMQNAKFFQQNSLGSEEAEEDNKAVEDALEESFNVLEDGIEEDEIEEAETLVFSADDFIPKSGSLAPPQEKPPPLPAGPPPAPPVEEETEIDKQEREIIETLEQEEQEHKRYLETLTASEERSSVSTQSIQSTLSTSKSWSAGVGAEAGGAGSRLQESQPNLLKPMKKEKETRDYSKHWLIQEAEQRRIAEAKQKQNLNLAHSSSSTGLEKIENINNNNSEYSGYNGEKRREHNVSDNIYANVDAANLNFNKNHR